MPKEERYALSLKLDPFRLKYLPRIARAWRWEVSHLSTLELICCFIYFFHDNLHFVFFIFTSAHSSSSLCRSISYTLVCSSALRYSPLFSAAAQSVLLVSLPAFLGLSCQRIVKLRLSPHSKVASSIVWPDSLSACSHGVTLFFSAIEFSFLSGVAPRGSQSDHHSYRIFQSQNPASKVPIQDCSSGRINWSPKFSFQGFSNQSAGALYFST